MTERPPLIGRLRPHQRLVHDSIRRFSCVVMHRRAGKSVYCVLRLMHEASQPGAAGKQFHYIGPSIKQTRAIAWKYVGQIASQLGGVTLRQSDLRATFPSGATVELLGVENIDSLRGRYSHGCVLDEAQLMPSSHWTYVVRPMLADRKGWALVSGTPAGRHNLLGWAAAQEDWFTVVLPCGDTDALDAGELASMRRSMSPEAWAQEMECSFTAALQGAYYARAMDALEREGRLTTVRYDAALPVTAALDLGHRDLMPVIWSQQAGTELRVIGVRTYQFTSIPDMVRDWRTLDWPTDLLIVPHDAKVRELGSGQTRQEVFHGLGVETSLAPNQPLDEGIEAVRQVLPHVWIDRDAGLRLFEALGAYRSEYDETRQVHRVTPLHDWSSHYADAMRYLAIGARAGRGWSGGARDYSGLGVYA